MPKAYILQLEWQHKIYCLLRVHKKYENEKMFGSSALQKGNLMPEYQHMVSPRIIKKD